MQGQTPRVVNLLKRASRFVDHQCDDYFGSLTATTQVFEAKRWPMVFPNYSIQSVTLAEIAPYSGATYTSLTSSQFVLQPDSPPPNEPYRWLEFMPYGTGPFGFFDPIYNTYPSSNYPQTAKVRLTGNFGWPSVPDDIVHLTLKIASRWWKAKDAGWSGVTGSAETGLITVRSLDDEDRQILKYYGRMGFA